MAWYDRRNDANDIYWDVYIAKSVDDGNNFSTNLCITDQSFITPSVGGGWIGEYLGLDVDANDAYIGFTSSITDTNNGDVYFDRVTNIQIAERGDFEPDGDVDFVDYATLAAAWLTDAISLNWNPACDISKPQDGIIDFKDVGEFVNNWLYGR